MKFSFAAGSPLKHVCEALIIGCWEDAQDESPLLNEFDSMLGGIITSMYERRDFNGKLNTARVIYTLGRTSAEKLLLIGLGKKGEATSEKVRQAGGIAVKTARGHGIRRLAHVLNSTVDDILLRASLEGIILGNYAFTKYQTKAKEECPVEEVTILADAPVQAQAIEILAAETSTICESVFFARDLVSQPANVAVPAFLAEKADQLALQYGLGCQILDREEMDRLGMNALLAVAKGSSQDPRLIILEYMPQPSQKPIVLVGKGVTFDSGGISLKPREGMEKMKNDMAGAAAVLAVLQAIAAMKLPLNVVGIVPAVENLPGGNAYKPGDLITSLSGQTIEIVNTDAEGRLILCDALQYAQRYNPAALVDIATLTGACVVALGNSVTGLMGNDDELKTAIKLAGEATGERVWALPLWDEYGELLKSDIADMKNAGGPNAASISAAWFLKQFVGNTPWVHLDIAGTAWEDKGKPYLPKGATGVGVRLLIEYLRGIAFKQ